MPPDRPHSAQRLRSALDVLQDHPHPDARWLVEALRAYERGAPDGVDLHQALGLPIGWWRSDATASRDAFLRAAYAEHFRGLMNITAAARTMAQRLARLREAAARGEMREGSDAKLIAALQTGAKLVGERQVLNIIASAREIE